MTDFAFLTLAALDAQPCDAVAVLTSEHASGAGGWQRILPAGSFSARDGRGPFVVGDRAAMEAIVAATRSYHGETDMVVDYDHQALAVMEAGSGKTAKAAGWVKGIEIRDDGIWADIQWTPAAATAIGAKEYRYLSPVIPHDAEGNVRMVLGVSLTNVPAYHLEALSSGFRHSHLKRTTDMDKILAALGLKPGSTEDAVLAALNALLSANTAIAAALGLDKDARPDQVQASALAAVEDHKALVETVTRVAGDEELSRAVAALTTLKAKGEPDPTKYVPIDQVTALATELKDLKTEIAGNAAEAAVNQAIKDGKLVPALKDWGIAMFTADKAKFDEFVGAAPTLTERQLKPAAKPGDQTTALTAVQMECAKALGIDPKAYAKTLEDERAAAL